MLALILVLLEAEDDAAVLCRRLLSCNPSVVESSDTATVTNDDNFMMMDKKIG